MQLTSNQYSTLSSLMNTSKNLITTLERSNILDRLVLFGAFALFAAVCAHIFKKRVIDRGVHVVGALGGIVAKGGGAVAGLASKAQTSDAIAEEATQVVKRGVADEWARATAAAAGAAGAVRAGIDMARSKANQVVTDRDVPTQTPSLVDSARHPSPPQRDAFEEAVPFEEEPFTAPVQSETDSDADSVIDEMTDSARESVRIVEDDTSLEEPVATAAVSDEPLKPAVVEPLDDHYDDTVSDEDGYPASDEESYDSEDLQSATGIDNDDDDADNDDDDEVTFPEAHEAETVAPRQPHPPTPSLPDILDLAFETPNAEEPPARMPDLQDDALSMDSGVALGGDDDHATKFDVEEDWSDEGEGLIDPIVEGDPETSADTEGETTVGGFQPDPVEAEAASDPEEFEEELVALDVAGVVGQDSAFTSAEPLPSEPLQLLDLDLPTDYSDLDLDAAPEYVWPVDYESTLQAEPLDGIEVQSLPRDVAGVEGTTRPLDIVTEEDAPPPLDVEELGFVPASDATEIGGQAVSADLPIDLDTEQTIWSDSTATKSLGDESAHYLDDVTTDNVPYEEVEQADESLLEAILEQQMGYAAGPGAFGDRPDFQDAERDGTGEALSGPVDTEGATSSLPEEVAPDLPPASEGRALLGDDEDEDDDEEDDHDPAEMASVHEASTYASTIAPTDEPTAPATSEDLARTMPPASPHAASTSTSPDAAASVDADDLPPSPTDPLEPAAPAAPVSAPEGAAVRSSAPPPEENHADEGAQSRSHRATEAAQTPASSPTHDTAQLEEPLLQQPELSDELELASAPEDSLVPTRAEAEIVEHGTGQADAHLDEIIEPSADYWEPENVLAADPIAVSTYDDDLELPESIPQTAYDRDFVEDIDEVLGSDLAPNEEGETSERHAEDVDRTPRGEETSAPAEDAAEDELDDFADDEDGIVRML